MIDLGYCLNLLDRYFINLVEFADKVFTLGMKVLDKELPVNKGKKGRFRDCAVINFLHVLNEAMDNNKFDSVRCMFQEGDPLYENSGFYKQTHIQLCIRNPNCIKAVFEPREINRNFPNP